MATGSLVAAAFLVACAAPQAVIVPQAAPPPPRVRDLPERVRDILVRFDADWELVTGFEPIEGTGSRERRLALLRSTKAAADGIDGSQLPLDARVDLRLLQAELVELETRVGWEEEDGRAAAPLLPFLAPIARLERSDRAGEPWEPERIGRALDEAATATRALQSAPSAEAAAALKIPAAVRTAIARARECHAFLDGWRKRDLPADPSLDFWVRTPSEQALAALAELQGWLNGTVLEELKKSPEGSPFAIGRDRYAQELAFESIALTPEQMLAFGEEQLASLQAEMTKETQALVASDGFGLDEELRDRPVDWKLGLELAKHDTVPIGGHRLFVQSVAEDSIRFAREQQLFPIPELCEACWRLRLSDSDTQKTYAYGFYGQNFMGVSAPTPDMEEQRKLECLKSNARPFSRTVVPHELIPGHHLQGFYARRRPERRRFHSPFFVEGWAVHTEMTFDEHGFFEGPRARLGHLFWRLLRAARIVVSTRYHTRAMTQPQMVDFMVENAGLERSAAQAEVDRYMTYSPLYQCAYLYGATQIRALREECKAAWGAQFSELRFNTELVEQGSIPIAFAREALLGDAATPRTGGGTPRR
jgi:hypothetical protein